MSTKEEVEVTTVQPTDLFENARYHGSRRALMGSILKEEIPFVEKLPETNNRRVFVLRHAERVDYTFPDFPSAYFDEGKNYQRKDLNMPKTLPERPNPLENWLKDTPLTNLGVFTAKSLGESFAGIKFDKIICSPFYRCIQTCDAFLEGAGLKDQLPICIEPGAWEWVPFGELCGWNSYGELFSPQELSKMGFNIDLSYEQLYNYNDLKDNFDEGFNEAWRRNEKVVEKCLQNEKLKNILIVAHGFNTYSCTNKFVGHRRKQNLELLQFMGKIPYCAFVTIEERPDKTQWDYVNPLSTMTHAGNYEVKKEFSNTRSPAVKKLIAKILKG
ncbi:ecdysteroid-phosphate phosphatase-like isoform X2 [Culicoides brevitarsis]|uniref:ecdysteroid-phosphate phosphatase-like isoform X1 n=1 Tax=Culicoides brevitarsis TaxID=469753 RepID=UPI00307B5210